MVRPQKFEREELLDRAIQVFWTHGYEGTSIPALTKQMGILSGSLYNTFGDKNSLFAECLSRYAEKANALLESSLSSAGSPKEAIARFFEIIITMLAADPDRKGCLVTNTITERGYCDTTIAQIIQASQETVEQAFYKTLTEAEQAGEIQKRSDAERKVLAQTLVNALNGIRVTAKTATHLDDLRAIAQMTLKLLD